MFLGSLVRLVARMPASIHTKLIASFLAIVALQITLGAVGLQALSATNSRAECVAEIERTNIDR